MPLNRDTRLKIFFWQIKYLLDAEHIIDGINDIVDA